MNASGAYSRKQGSRIGGSATTSSLFNLNEKSSTFGSLKKLFDRRPIDRMECVSSLDIYQRTRAIKPDELIKTRGGDANRVCKREQVDFEKLNARGKGIAVSDASISTKNRTSLVYKNDVQAPTGLRNLGNTCYINAILQCLRCTEVLRDYCIQRQYVENHHNTLRSDGGVLFPAFANVISKMQNGTESASTAIYKFKTVFSKVVPSYKGNMQQDAFEFFTYLMDGLHEEIKERDPLSISSSTISLTSSREGQGTPQQQQQSVYCSSGLSDFAKPLSSPLEDMPKANTTKRWAFRRLLQRTGLKTRSSSRSSKLNKRRCQTMPGIGSAETTASETSFLKETFVGHLQTRLRCCECNYLTTRDELFWNLALCVPEQVKSSPGNNEKSVPLTVSLHDCLTTFTKTETLDDMNRPVCDHCKIPTKAELQVVISHLPKILSLQFQRFDSTCSRNKKRYLIDFGFDLDLEQFTTKSTESCEETTMDDTQSSESPRVVELGDTRYRLYAVVYHQGNTDRGHYTTKARLGSTSSKNEIDKWYLFDDEHVTQVKNMAEIIDPTAYILFYERVDVEQTESMDKNPDEAELDAKKSVLFNLGPDEL